MRTSVTIDEAVGTLMGWVDGPVVFRLTTEYPTQEEQDMLDEVTYSVKDELDQLAAQYETELIEARLEKCSESVIAEKKEAIAKHAEVTRRARAYYCAVSDELNRGEQSLLRVDTATSNEHFIYITLTSLDEWAIDRFGIPILESLDKSTLSVEQAQSKSPAGRVKLRDQEKVILEQLVNQGYDPKSLPKNTSGKDGVKKAVRTALEKNPLFEGKTSFDKAWERLRNDGSIQDKL